MVAVAGTKMRQLLAGVPGVPCRDAVPVFDEPWQAQAFAMALTLKEKGVFSWGEWADMLGEEIKKALALGDPDDGSTYYRHWMATLERLVSAKGLVSKEALDATANAWGRAAERTPHGEPIVLAPGEFTQPTSVGD